MRVIEGYGVNDLYATGVRMLKNDGVLEQTRNGPALVMPLPVTGVYHRPNERVLLNRKRNANPFFHLYESLWMLAGRDDVASLNRYIGNFGQRFAEPDGRVHGAYGFRWRRTMGFDQIEAIVERLKNNPQDRQCVLQMWDGSVMRSNDLCGDWKDRPCNTHIYFRVRTKEPEEKDAAAGIEPWRELDMTICCRSNDIIYGAYGANAVHFSVLMEYVAGRLGVEIGTMYQISNNYHGYVSTMPEHIPEWINYYDSFKPLPMGTSWEDWDSDLAQFMSWLDNGAKSGVFGGSMYVNQWFGTVAEPMFTAFNYWKAFKEKNLAVKIAHQIEADDWRQAALQWFESRMTK